MSDTKPRRPLVLPLVVLGVVAIGGVTIWKLRGSGRQVMSWIHLHDWVSLVSWLAEHPSSTGAYNCTAPNPVTNAELSKALGVALGRPSWLQVPGFVLKILLGEMAGVALLAGQRVIPRRALDAGFSFEYPDISSAMLSAVHLR